MSDIRKDIRVAYAGARLNGKKKVYAYYDIELGKEYVFGSKLMDVGIGLCFYVEEATDTNWKGFKLFKESGESIVKRYEDADKVTEWTALNRSTLDELKAKSEAAKDHPASIEVYLSKILQASDYMNKRQKNLLALYFLSLIHI